MCGLFSTVKYYFRCQVEFERDVPETDERQRTTAQFYVPPVISSAEPLNVNELTARLQNSVESFTSRGSGWNVSQIINLSLCIGVFRPLAGSSFIPTPAEIAKKQAVINIRNHNNNNCFQYSILAALHPASSNVSNSRSYDKYFSELDMTGIETPVALSSIPKFESQNPSISVNVLVYENKEAIPVYTSKFCNQRPNHVNLLLLSKNNKYHYTLIKSLSRLVYGRTESRHKSYVCPYCLHPFRYEHCLQSHLPECSQHPAQHIQYPEQGHNILKFEKFQHMFPVPFVLYGDFESYIRPNNEHEPSGFCCLRVSIFPEHDHKIYTYSGDNVIQEFFKYIKKEQDAINEILSTNLPMNPLTDEEISVHDAATTCFTCEKEFTANNVKVHHHSHITGKYLAPVCNNCNLQFKHRKWNNKYFIPLFMHNARSYDSHFIIKNLHDSNAKVQVIPTNTEKFLAVQIDSIRFLDSCQFLSSKLDDLVFNMARDGTDNFVHTKRHFGNDPNVFKKGVYPYEYVTGPEILTETSLPPREKFYSELVEEGISEEQYDRALEMWQRYDCKTLRDYHDLYLTLDVTLLADVFENFRNMSLREYKLDPAHSWTVPGFAWNCALKMSRVELELITDPDIFLFFENSIRGGISTVSHRYAKANNKYLSDHDPNLPSQYLIYLDANNLYGYSLSQPLPTGKFRFLDNPEVFDIDYVDCDGDTGYVLEVDLQYPSHLHDDHNDYPLAPEHMTVTKEMISDYNRDSLFVGQSCLVPNLNDKIKYVTHIRNVKLYKQLGLIVTKIHRVLAFQQSRWLQSYVNFNTDKRKAATSVFEKDFFKLMSNSVYGKSMENLRKRMNVELVNNEKRVKKVLAKPTCKSFTIINEDLVMVQFVPKKIVQNKPLYTGFVVLELSKVLMYEFHYNHIQAKYGADRARLLFTDTDSLCYQIQTDDLYRDMKPNLQHYDTSAYPIDHDLYDTTNEKVIGKFKDETNSVPPQEFVGLRAKMYSLYVPRNKKQSKMTAKGIKKSYIKHHVRHSTFLSVLRDKEPSSPARFKAFKSINHVVSTVDIDKVCLSPFDTKRYILSDGISTLAYGHYRLRDS